MLDASTGHTGSAPPTADVPVVTKADLRRAAWGSSAGSALEYYDFALYSLASALVFGPLFFPGGNAATGLVLSFATYFIGFAVRPLGGVFFGRLGDRLGRKFVLMARVIRCDWALSALREHERGVRGGPPRWRFARQ